MKLVIAIRKLYSHRIEAQTQSAQMLKLFDGLFSLSFIALRETVPFVKLNCPSQGLLWMSAGVFLPVNEITSRLKLMMIMSQL